MDFGKALTYPFEDDDWLAKLGIGLVVGLVPIVNFALAGWLVKLVGNVKRSDERPLPAWEDFGDHFKKGLLVAVAWLIYQAPVVLFYCVVFIVVLAAGGGAAALEEFGSGGGEVLGPVVTIVLACCGCLAAIYGIAAAITFLGGLIRFVDTETFGTFMEFGTNLGLVRDNLGKFVMAGLYVFAVQIVLSLASSVTLGLGYLLMPIVLTYFSGHILGQLSQQLEEGGALAPAV